MSTWLDSFLAEGLTKESGKGPTPGQGTEPGGARREGPGEGAARSGVDSGKVVGGTPPSNTGGVTLASSISQESELCCKYLHEFRIDYLTIVVHRESENDRLVKVWMGNRGITTEPCRAYNCHTLYRCEWDENIRAHRGDKYWVWVLPGGCRKLCEVAFWVELHKLLSKPVKEPADRVNVSRCDVTMDQLASTIIPLRYPFQVLEHFKASKFVHRYEKHKFWENEIGACLRMFPDRWRDDPWNRTGTTGAWVSEETLYLGSREGSAYMLRCYDQHGPLRWEWEVKGDASLPLVRQMARRISEGERMGEVFRENWIGIANRQLACEWWDKLGEGEAVNPEPVPDSTIETSIKSSIEQYGALHLAIAEQNKMGRYLNLCKIRAARSTNRMALCRAKRIRERLQAGGELLWSKVEKLVKGEKEVAIEAA